MSPARRAVGDNLTQALGSCPRAAMRDAFRTYSRYYLSLMRLAHLPALSAVGPVLVEGEEHLRRTLERGRGALLLGAHFGNWDVAAIALAQRFGALHAFAEPLRPARLWRFYARVRARHGVRALPAGGHRRVPFAVLHDNGLLGLLADRPFGVRQERVPFGRGELGAPTGAIRLGLRAGSGIHATFAVRAADGFVVRIGADLGRDLAPAEEGARVREVTARFATALHRLVLQHPGQWCLMHRVQPHTSAPDASLAEAG
jgi:KDO2-lipid IV(A) lauroyltransferase